MLPTCASFLTVCLILPIYFKEALNCNKVIHEFAFYEARVSEVVVAPLVGRCPQRPALEDAVSSPSARRRLVLPPGAVLRASGLFCQEVPVTSRRSLDVSAARWLVTRSQAPAALCWETTFLPASCVPPT